MSLRAAAANTTTSGLEASLTPKLSISTKLVQRVVVVGAHRRRVSADSSTRVELVWKTTANLPVSRGHASRSSKQRAHSFDADARVLSFHYFSCGSYQGGSAELRGRRRHASCPSPRTS